MMCISLVGRRGGVIQIRRTDLCLWGGYDFINTPIVIEIIYRCYCDSKLLLVYKLLAGWYFMFIMDLYRNLRRRFVGDI